MTAKTSKTNDASKKTDAMLAKIRALLAKAQDPAATEDEAQTLTAKATELMAKYGIDRARLAEKDPATDVMTDKIIDVHAPWARAKASLLMGLARVMRCQGIRIALKPMTKVHVFGYSSDIERVELLYTSLLLQMANALNQQDVPADRAKARHWRNQWVLGYKDRVVARVRLAEKSAADNATKPTTASGKGTALVLANRESAVEARYTAAYPDTSTIKPPKITNHRSYGAGYKEGGKADIGGPRVKPGARGELS